eukprot:6213549-Pleurochrysis_carterae.AAC.4
MQPCTSQCAQARRLAVPSQKAKERGRVGAAPVRLVDGRCGAVCLPVLAPAQSSPQKSGCIIPVPLVS